MKRKVFSNFLEKGQNNFDLIRLVAALAVIYGHLFGPDDIVHKLSAGLEYSGSVAVYSFFLLSGILITASYERQKSSLQFLKLRVARIYPAMWVCVIASVAIVGVAFTTIKPIGTFLTDSDTLTFVANNFLLVNVKCYLPGAFDKTYTPGAINFQWWTLPVEFACYFLVLGMGLCGFFRTSLKSLGAVSVLFGLFLLGAHFRPAWKFFTITGGYSFYPVPFFLLGVLIYKFREHIIIDGRIALGILMAFLAVGHTRIGGLLFYPCFVYGFIWLSTWSTLHRFRPKNDYSYGIYIYGFLCIQIVESSLPPSFVNSGMILIGAVPLAIICGALSWHFIEKPIMQRCRA